LLSTPLKAEYQLRCASDCVNSGKFGTWTSAPAAPRTLGDQRIRVAYVSSDFADHPVSFLMAGVFEHHDRARFDITAVSLNPDPPRTSGYRERIKAAADQFILGSDKTDTEIVQSLRRGGCDIAIDLNGFTIGHRLGIFGSRAAPIQVNYLGFPGTMGARFIDYILADEFTIPRELQHLYSEKVVYLPEVFQANDSGRKISDRVPSRSDLGLPPTGFVFASLNAPYKITPQIFDVWMRVLKQVDGGVLLLQGGPSERNLRTEAERRGVAGGRLVFASWAPYPEYLARYKVADLFLDTMPFSGGTTTSDALWAGLPVLTLPGDAFASRMSGSLLRAADLPELIAGSPEEYEAIAVRLARDPELLAATKAKLNRNRRGGPLFDTARFTAHLETAFSMMCDRHRRGEHPESFSVLTR
jgi:predicted O-linked N-acetylglucosamine transferase (SPINDLY family)